MEALAEHINIQVEELLSNEVIQWEDILNVLKKLQSISLPLSEALVNLLTQLQIHYENDLNLAKTIYQNKAIQYDLFTAKMQLNEMKLNEFAHEDEEEENSDFGDEQENGIILEGIKTTETFNFPIINEMDSCFDGDNLNQQDTSICTCNTFEIPNHKYVNVATQEENFDAKKINRLIYENNQYLKVAKSWKMQYEASILKIEEMKKKRKNVYNFKSSNQTVENNKT